MTALNSMPASSLASSATCNTTGEETRVQIKLANNSSRVAFFVRAEVLNADGQEVLPIRYDDNYITVFPHESRTLDARFDGSLLAGESPGLKIEGYNVARQEQSRKLSCAR